MKKNIVALTLVLLLVGCGSGNTKADKQMSCYLGSTNEASSMTTISTTTFNSKSEEVFDQSIQMKYSNMEKTQENNSILQNMFMRKETASDVKGLEIDVKTTNTDFEYSEHWNYREVDAKDALNLFEEQKDMQIDGVYNLKKIETFYTQQGYSCDVEDIKK